MKRWISLFFLAAALWSACATQQKTTTSAVVTSAQDGSSYEKAILVNSIPAEYGWLRQHYPGHSVTMQALTFSKKIPYDILSIVLKDGTKKDVYFDIHKFYGKF